MDQPILQNQQNEELRIDVPEFPISIEYMAQQPQCQKLIQQHERRNFLIFLMLISFCQTGIELLIIFISTNSYNVSELKLSFAIPMFLILLIAQLLILSIIKSKPKIRNTLIKEILLILIYTTIVTSLVSIFGVRLFQNTILIYGILQFQVCLLSSYFIMGVQFAFDQDPNIKQTLVSSMVFPLIISIIFIVTPKSINFQNCLNHFCIDFEFSVMIFFIFVFIFYLGFATSQVISLFQILNGKFGLQHNQFIIANLLLFYNTLLPFLE